MPPGAIGRQQLSSGRITAGYVQPVRIKAPAGTLVAPVEAGTIDAAQPAPVLFGLQVGYAYRFQLSDIPLMEGVELFPTVEIIDRLHPPAGRSTRHPVPVEFSKEDITLAAAGNLVTRVVYVEEPLTAIPVTQRDQDGQPYFDVVPGDDPLQVADYLGRAIAIVRIGSRSLHTEFPEPELNLTSPPIERLSTVPVAVGGVPRAVPMQSVSGQARRIDSRQLPPPVPFQGPSAELIQRAGPRSRQR